MARNQDKVRTASRRRQRRYRERLRANRAPTSDKLLRAIRQAFIDEVESFRSHFVPAPEVARFIGAVAGRAKRRLVDAGHDPDLTAERLAQVLLSRKDEL